MSENKIKFLVQGSSDEPYDVIFSKEGGRFTASCTCTAGQYGRCCKHRLNILADKRNAIVSDNLEDVDTVKSWLPGSHLESALSNVKEAERIAAEARRNLSSAKTRLAQVMEYG